MVPKPVSSLTIPSIHDDTTLDCRIYHPPRFTVNEKQLPIKGAIVAHPYAPLGGSYDDPVVQIVVSELLKEGFVVGTFNLRGAGNSHGSTSWTAKPELSDYVSFVGFFIYYLHGLELGVRDYPTQSPGPGSGSPLSPVDSSVVEHAESLDTSRQRMVLVVGGYSYGSLLTMNLPSIENILRHFDNVAHGTAEAECRLRALTLSTRWISEVRQDRDRGSNLKVPDAIERHTQTVTMGGEESEPGTRKSRDSRRSIDVVRRSMERSRTKLGLRRSIQSLGPPSSSLEENLANVGISHPKIYYLLISPLLSPISTFATMFTKLSVSHRAQDQSSKHDRTSHRLHSEDHKLQKHPTLAIYGDKDFFTSQKKLRKWAEHLKEASESQFRFSEIPGAGHFWHEEGVEGQLRGVIRNWMANVVEA